MKPLPTGRAHVAALAQALPAFMIRVDTAVRWGEQLAEILSAGGRLLVCGNGGSAAQAQHLSAELVGRYRDDRAPFSALALHADTSATTAIGNDYGPDAVFARQVRAHGRPGDVLLALSTSGASSNVLAAAAAAQLTGLRTWGLTGRGPNPLANSCDECLCVDAQHSATVQELHLVALHALCAAFDIAIGVSVADTADSVDTESVLR